MDVSVAYISRVESGDSHLNLKRLNEICSLLNTTESYILDGVSNEKNTYLSNEFSAILKDCSSSDKELIYKIATIISEKRSKEK